MIGIGQSLSPTGWSPTREIGDFGGNGIACLLAWNSVPDRDPQPAPTGEITSADRHKRSGPDDSDLLIGVIGRLSASGRREKQQSAGGGSQQSSEAGPHGHLRLLLNLAAETITVRHWFGINTITQESPVLAEEPPGKPPIV
ncbi:hypothetical protein [Goodfellowiella coeruleoviolacea]|uniref:hypothetical protein n=1 Tax=Goodfellowiella coeruleoviolacea TaxID=334858 RepID=UPI0020A39129|nr:hypothetical protein [Goodfellowiella coeruleoviolacea]